VTLARVEYSKAQTLCVRQFYICQSSNSQKFDEKYTPVIRYPPPTNTFPTDIEEDSNRPGPRYIPHPGQTTQSSAPRASSNSPNASQWGKSTVAQPHPPSPSDSADPINTPSIPEPLDFFRWSSKGGRINGLGFARRHILT